MLIHVVFAVLFAEVTLSFPPPVVKGMSLTILTREGGSAEIVRSEAAWPMPKRVEPEFSAGKALKGLDAGVEVWGRPVMSDSFFFVSPETMVSHKGVVELTDEAYSRPPDELFSRPHAESKAMPVTDFALGPTLPDILEGD